MLKRASRMSLRDVRNAELQRKHLSEKTEKCILLFVLNVAAKQRFLSFPRTIDLFTAASALQRTNNLLITREDYNKMVVAVATTFFCCVVILFSAYA